MRWPRSTNCGSCSAAERVPGRCAPQSGARAQWWCPPAPCTCPCSTSSAVAGAHVENLAVEAQPLAGPRVIAVEDDLAVRDVGDREHHAAAVLVVGAGVRLELHADLDLGRQPVGRLELDELGIVVAESVFRLDVDGHRVAGLLEIERCLELRQHAGVPAVQVGDGLVRRLEQHAVGVEELEGQRDDGVGEDVHGRPVGEEEGRAGAASARRCSAGRTRPRGRHCSAAPRRRLAIIGRWLAPPAPARTRAPAAPLGGLAAAAFLRRHWHKEPLLVRGAMRRLHRALRRAGALRARPARRRRVAARRARRRALVARPRPVPPRRFQVAARAQLDAARAGRQSGRSGGRRAAAPLLVPAVRAPGRPDGELRRARRRRRPALRFVRCLPAAGLRAAPLALRPPGRPRAEAAAAAEDPAAVRARRTTQCWRRATCSTCRRSTRTTASPSTPARRTRSAFARPGATELAAAFLDFLRDELDLPGRYADPDLAPVRAPAEIGPAMRRRCAQLLEGIAWDRDDGRALPRLLAFGTETACLLRAAPAGAVAGRVPRPDGEARRAPGHAHAAPLRPRPPLHQRRRPALAGGRRRDAAAARQHAFARGAPRPRACPRRRPGFSTIGIAMATSTPTPPDGGTIRRSVAAAGNARDRCRAGRRDRYAARPRQALDPRVRRRSVRHGLERRGARRRRSRRSCGRTRRQRSRSSCTTRGWIERSCPRLLNLLKFRGHAIAIRRTGAGRDARRWIRC